MAIMITSPLLLACLLLGLAGAAPLLLLLTRSRLHRRLHCPWCWQQWHVMRYYPPRWSSTLCRYHKQQLLARRTKREQARL